MKIVLTGGAGFMGSSVARAICAAGHSVVVLDALTYAGKRAHLAGLPLTLIEGDICDPAAVEPLIGAADTVVHMAAESHVERSFSDPSLFFRTNTEGTRIIADACARLGRPMLHVSTDEVFGTAPDGVWFREDAPFLPGNPYAASKAAAECVVQAWRHSRGLRAKIVRCTNNYGPRQHTEKAVMSWIGRALQGEPLLLHGRGEAIRDWLHVEDFAAGLCAVLHYEGPRTQFHLAGQNHRSNRAMAETILGIVGTAGGGQVVEVADRPGQDARYALDDAGTRADLGWAPRITLEAGLSRLVDEVRAARNGA